jgi:4'-phosphopantetheinyl transferase
VHVWLVDLGTGPPQARELLDGSERERAARIVDPLRRDRFVAVRALLRELLGRYAGADPRGLVLTGGDDRKPALAAGAAGAPEFNVSHSGAHALLAFSAAGPVGVDLERARALRAPLALARSALGEQVVAELSALPAEERDAAFLRAWTRREAAVKLTGEGLRGGSPASPWIQELPVGAGVSAALALRDAPAALLLLERVPD